MPLKFIKIPNMPEIWRAKVGPNFHITLHRCRSGRGFKVKPGQQWEWIVACRHFPLLPNGYAPTRNEAIFAASVGLIGILLGAERALGITRETHPRKKP